MSQLGAVTPASCDLCGGPCKEPFRLPPIHDRYPFLPPEIIAMTHQQHEPAEPDPAPAAPTGRRAKRLAEDRMRRPGENTAHEKGDDR